MRPTLSDDDTPTAPHAHQGLSALHLPLPLGAYAPPFLQGLSALHLDPTAPPLVGGRTGLLILAMLISVNSANGHPRWPYFMWTDALVLSQISILAVGLAQVIMPHPRLSSLLSPLLSPLISPLISRRRCGCTA